MKSDVYQKRFYRELIASRDLHLLHIMHKETDMQILANKPVDRAFVEEKIRLYRWEIENYISKDHRFFSALKPVPVDLTATAMVQDMAAQSHKANVGPMSAVAGAIAGRLGKELIKEGYREVVIENGGDLFIKSTKVRTVGIYAGRSRVWNNLKLLIHPKDTPLGICTSSGVLGHSLSFGCADSVVVISKDPCLADAVATATANQVKVKTDIPLAIEFAKKIKGVIGVIIILKNEMASWGEIEFVEPAKRHSSRRKKG